MSRPLRTVLGPFLLSGLLVAAGCSLLVDVDETEGHPCDAQGRCLIGYACVNDVCVKADTGVKECSPACDSDHKCDLRAGTCVAPCDATVCPAGTACRGAGTCETVQSGLGASCRSDSDCAGAVPDCSTDPANPGRVLCICAVPVGATAGVCIGLPSVSDDCEACGDAACVQGRFSNAGETSLCVPSGFRTCEAASDCADPDNASNCTLLGWGQDPANRSPGSASSGAAPLGWLAACAAPADGWTLPAGAECDPASPDGCESGLCVPMSGGGLVCTRACSDDAACSGIAGGRCVDAPIEATLPSGEVFDVVRVCGSSPTLGAPCDDAAGGGLVCGTDAPWCETASDGSGQSCARTCLDDGDCATDQGFTCRASGLCQ